MCDTEKDRQRILKNLFDAQYAPEEQGFLASVNLLCSLWLFLGLCLTTIGSSDYMLYTGMIGTFITIAINLKNNLPLKFRAQYHYKICGVCPVPWPSYNPTVEDDNDIDGVEMNTRDEETTNDKVPTTHVRNPSYGVAQENLQEEKEI